MRFCIKYECPDPVVGDSNTNREVYCEYHKELYSRIPDPGPSSSALKDARTAAVEVLNRANGY